MISKKIREMLLPMHIASATASKKSQRSKMATEGIKTFAIVVAGLLLLLIISLN